MAGDALNAPPSNRMLASGRGPGPSHRLGDPSFDLHRWDANDGPGIALATLQDRLRNVVAVATSALGRVARAHPVAAIVKELAGVAEGLAESLAHPGGNVTRTAIFSSEIMAKRLELLKRILPSLRRAGVLVKSRPGGGDLLP